MPPTPTNRTDGMTQIATVNKLKQKLRNAIASDLSLAVPFLRLAINDGLGFDQAVRACCCRACCCYGEGAFPRGKGKI